MAKHGETSDLAMPIHLTSTYLRDKDGTYPGGYSYSRTGNPNRDSLERQLAQLENGIGAVAFSSGTAATMAIFQSLSSGDHVLVANDCYWGTRAHLDTVFSRWNLQYDFVDMLDLPLVKSSIKSNTKLFWIETPSNPMLRVTDIVGITQTAIRHGIKVVCDNTLATGYLQKPLSLGTDYVVLSTTKYIGGHHDAIGGAVIVRENSEDLSIIRKIQHHGGAIPSPFDCWLIARGLCTLPLRIKAQSQSAQIIAEHLQTLKNVHQVHYPGLSNHPSFKLNQIQMQGGGGLLSFQVYGGKEAAFSTLARLNHIKRATSLGGIETTAEHRASMEGPGTKTPSDLIRLSVGLESVDDLIADIDQAIHECQQHVELS